MARTPNYGFERRQREQTRAKKKADRQRVKQEKSDLRKGEPGADVQAPADAEQESGTEIAPPAALPE
jgi:hypothetical protein